VLKAIESESSAWCDRWELQDENGVDAADYFRRRLEQAIAEAEPIVAKAEAKLVEREEQREKRERERQERLAREKREREEREAKTLRDAYRQGEIDAGCEQYTVAKYIGGEPRIFDAYLAGVSGKPIPGLEIKTNGSGQQH
jgi:hypothetical protein